MNLLNFGDDKKSRQKMKKKGFWVQKAERANFPCFSLFRLWIKELNKELK